MRDTGDRPGLRACAAEEPTNAAQKGIIIGAEQAMKRHHQRRGPVRLLYLRTRTPGSVRQLPGTHTFPSTLEGWVPAPCGQRHERISRGLQPRVFSWKVTPAAV